ncbi:hypothetical protein A2U01_0048402 [Trifolium medium]|uniref:Uncharacterized protein n=1 Tax=Trifolium medium TaxID=97028 RepID=A0A392QTN4_9FABA|nr:hypothetical protein [Trifolium medium]
MVYYDDLGCYERISYNVVECWIQIGEVERDKKLAERIKKIADQFHKTVDAIEDDEGTEHVITMEVLFVILVLLCAILALQALQKMYAILSTALPSFLGFLVSHTWKQCLKEFGSAFTTLASQQISVGSVMMILTGGAILRGIVHWNRFLADKNMERIGSISQSC